MSTALVIGLGSVDRGDDAVGPEVARAVAARGPRAVRVVEHEDPTALLDLWPDTIRSSSSTRCARVGRPARSIGSRPASGAPRMPERAWSATGRGGTHAFGLAAAVELGRALHRLPPRLVVVGVEADGFDYGAPLTAPVAAAVPAAVACVLAVLSEVSADVPR